MKYTVHDLAYSKGVSEPVRDALLSMQEQLASPLVLAAPELLEALRGVLRVADRATDEFDAARAAILKATGGQP